MKFPKHEASLHLTHNQHKAYYETVESYLSNRSDVDWAADGQEEKALATQELWELQWYPDTPIGSYCIYGSDLSVVLERALEIEEGYTNERRT